MAVEDKPVKQHHPESEAPMEVNGRPYLPVRINGAGPYAFLFDTGSVGVTMQTELAVELGLSCSSGDRTEAARFSIGDTQWENMPIGIADHAREAQLLNRPIPGMIGTGFLWYIREQYHMVLDYPGHRVLFRQVMPNHTDARYDSLGVWVNTEIHNYYLILPVRVNGHGPYPFFLDTGAYQCIISPNVADLLDLPRGEKITSRGVVSHAEGYRSHVSSLSIGDASCRDLAVHVVDCSAAARYTDTRVEGYIGNDFLKAFAVTFDWERSRICFERPKPER